MVRETASLASLYDLMAQEVISYEALLVIMKREWECLKNADTSSLLPLLQDKESHISRIRTIHESIERALSRVGPTFSDSIPYVPFHSDPKVKDYRKKLRHLKDQLSKANQQNRYFIQETLNSLNEFFSILMPPGQADTVYSKYGRKTVPELSLSWMNRRI